MSDNVLLTLKNSIILFDAKDTKRRDLQTWKGEAVLITYTSWSCSYTEKVTCSYSFSNNTHLKGICNRTTEKNLIDEWDTELA